MEEYNNFRINRREVTNNMLAIVLVVVVAMLVLLAYRLCKTASDADDATEAEAIRMTERR